MYLPNCPFLALVPLFLVGSSLESPVNPTTVPESEGGGDVTSGPSSNGFIRSSNAEISYFWHQKGKDLLPLWPLDSPASSKDLTNGRERVILIHQITDEPAEGEGVKRRGEEDNGLSTGFSRGRDDPKFNNEENTNNVFVFCLMFLFGLIICGLIWCLCTVSRHQVDNNGDFGPSGRMNSRFRRRRADIEVILPYSTDLPPSYDDIVADFEKLGAQCILPSYKDIMTKKAAVTSDILPAVSPPPCYTSPVGSFSAQGSRAESQSSPNSPTGVRRSS